MMKRMRRSKDLGIGGMMARWYDKNTRKHRLSEMKQYAQEVSNHIKTDNAVLEVAPGPGYFAIELAKLGKYKITGMDISQDFVEIARRNAKDAGVDIEFQQGNVSEMPFPDNKFDFIFCSAAFKNFKDPSTALDEMYRVLKPGGMVLIADMNRNVSDRAISEFVKKSGEKGFEAIFMKFTFKYFLKTGAYSKDEFINLISKTKFSSSEIKEEGIGFYIFIQK
jgi:ubiquinone/menaquinone biosynthesis C-methylase UbiE